LDEIPNIWGVFGIFITCIGSYVLNMETGSVSIADPIKAIIREKGSWMMLIVAFIFSFAAVIGKKAILHSSVLFFQVSFFLCFNSIVVLSLWYFRKIRLQTFKTAPLRGIIAGGLFSAHVFLHGFAIALTKAAYMISVKRLSILIGILYGGFFFHERNIIIRFCGAVLMLSGAVLIILKGQSP
jgi:drug/metabolite transporter (DMT)-like permease